MVQFLQSLIYREDFSLDVVRMDFCLYFIYRTKGKFIADQNELNEMRDMNILNLLQKISNKEHIKIIKSIFDIK